MADSKVTSLPAASTPLGGTEVVYLVQGGLDTQATAQDIANLATDAVTSVNGQTGVVVLDTGDVASVLNNRYVTDAELTVIQNTSGVNTGDQTITLTGEATGTGTGSFAVTLTNSAVIGKVLTGFSAAAGVVAATDTILQAFNKIVGNIAGLVTGVSSVFGRTGAVVAQVGDYDTSEVPDTTDARYVTDAESALLGGITASAAEINILDGATLTTTELNYVDGVTSSIQAQLDAKEPTITPAALTKADDTNVTLTLGGSPATALLNAASITAGWTGQLSAARGGTGNTTGTATNVTVANEATDTTCFPLFVTAATGDLPAKSNTSLTYNSNTGLLSASALTASGQVNASAVRFGTGSTGSVLFNGTGKITMPTDGNLLLRNDDSTTFGRINLGGTTSSFPAIKRNATAINFRLADDSADASITAAGILASGDIGVTATRVPKIWATDIESTNAPTIGGTAATGTGGLVRADSAALTGTPTAPTAAAGTNTTQIATTAFVAAAAPQAFGSYTPTVAASTGTITTSSATGVYQKLSPNLCWFTAIATITTNGTGAGQLRIGTPFGIVTSTSMGSGIEGNVAGKMVNAIFTAGNSYATVVNYDFTYPASSGAVITISGIFRYA